MVRALTIAAVCATAAGCHHAPPPAPPPAERAVNSPADLAGQWRTEDDMDFSYRLTIGTDGKVDLVVDRSRMGQCEQVGTLATDASAAAGAKTFKLTYAKDTCHNGIGSAQQVASGYAAPLAAHVVSFTGDVLELDIKGDGVSEHRVYRREPAAAQK